jgi:4-methyl-5(b-hydroxyethyl)-thiazole monophosphate biosynthesis
MENVLLILTNDFEEIEALSVVDILRRANIKCDMCSVKNIDVIGAHGITVKADFTIEELDEKNYGYIVLPGGKGAYDLKDNPKVIELVKSFNNKDKTIAAICAAPIVLNEADIIKGKKITSYPSVKENLLGCEYKEDKVVEDGKLITSRGPATVMEFALKLVENIAGKEEMDKLSEAMLFNLTDHLR